jgi:hypothetical protein
MGPWVNVSESWYYTSAATFAAALVSTTVEDFADTTLVPGLSFVSTVGSIGGGVFNDRVIRSSQSTAWSFTTAQNGFGGNWDLRPGGAGQGIEFVITLLNNTTLTIGTQVPNSYSGQFFGFTSTDAFKKVSYTGGTQPGVAETHNLDNLSFGSAVPEPAAWAMLITGFGLVGAVARRRRMAVAA